MHTFTLDVFARSEDEMSLVKAAEYLGGGGYWFFQYLADAVARGAHPRGGYIWPPDRHAQVVGIASGSQKRGGGSCSATYSLNTALSLADLSRRVESLCDDQAVTFRIVQHSPRVDASHAKPSDAQPNVAHQTHETRRRQTELLQCDQPCIGVKPTTA